MARRRRPSDETVVRGCGRQRAHEPHLYFTEVREMTCPGIEPITQAKRETAAAMLRRTKSSRPVLQLIVPTDGESVHLEEVG